MSPMKPHPLLLFLLLPLQALATCTCSTNLDSHDPTKALHLKLIAIASILTAGALGVLIPILGRSISFLQPEHTGFFIIKAFAAGVILATGLIHILPEAFERLTSPCLGNPHHRFPFAGFIAMVSALATMMVDAYATSYYKRSQMNKARPVEEEEEDGGRVGEAAPPPAEHAGGHVHGSHGRSYGSPQDEGIRNRVISQVLEVGIVVHSVIIGFSLGSSMRPSTIRTLVGALSFHQLFEGIGLGGCIVQANYRVRSTMVMAAFFSFTAPFGIMLGILAASRYDPKSSAALIVEGGFGAASAGILIYMALVDFLAADFMNPRMQSNARLQLGANVALMIGCGLMSLLAKWA